MSSDQVVMYDSPEAAQRVTVEGWRSRDGRFYGDDEHLARWAGCTHQKCACGALMSRGYTRCEACQSAAERARWEALPVVEWDGETPLCLFHDDKFFFSLGDIQYYCDEHECAVTDLMLVLCEGRRLSIVEEDYWADDLPEDGDLPAEIAEALKRFNDVIRAYPSPAAYFPTRRRVAITTESL